MAFEGRGRTRARASDGPPRATRTMSQSTYKRLGKLGSGAFATTFVVEEIGRNGARSDKKLVMKRAPCKHMRAANAALQEVKVLLSCTHRGIVGYHDFFLDADGDDNVRRAWHSAL